MSALLRMILIIPAILAVAGVAGFVWWVRAYRRLVWVRGVVTGHDESEDGEGKVYRSRLEYEAEGQSRAFRDEMGFGYHAHRVGQEVWVGYPASDPSRGRVWRVWPALASAGVAAAGAGVLWLGLTRT